MRGTDLHEAVRAKVEGAELHPDPFPHVVIPNLLPDAFFGLLAGSIPPLEFFEQSKRGLKANLVLEDDDPYFAAAPQDFREVWTKLRDGVVSEEIAPLLVRRLESAIREKFAALFSSEIADEVMADGFETTGGRIMARKPGYVLRAHTDSAHYAVTCLLYFTSAEDESSGALCLFRPERTPELRHVSTYFPDREEGIEAELVKTIPIRENLFVAFLNDQASLHGLQVDRTDDSQGDRITYQSHIVPRRDLRPEAATLIERLADPAARQRWARYAEAG
jgi:hypothetical protein